MKAYQARISLPMCVLGIVAAEDAVTEIDFLPADTSALAPSTPLAEEVCRQLSAYLADPQFRFSLPLQPKGTLFQRRVWQALMAIPPGQTRTYGELARDLGSAARAVGQACGANPLPLVIPCHRVLGSGGLGGFMHHSAGGPLEIKRLLLLHERAELGPA